MRRFRGIGLFLILAIMSCATNKEIVRDNTKTLMKKYRGDTDQRIAVFPFMTKSQQKSPELINLDDEVMDIVFEDKRFKIVERGLVEQITKEWTFSESGMVDEEQRSKIGKLSGAKLILVPMLSDKRNINMRIISVNSGDVLSYVRGSLAKPILDTISGENQPVISPKVPDQNPIGGGGSSISLGSAASGGIYQGGQIDNYSFNLRSPKTVEIRADRTDSSFDPFLELRNSSGMMIASDDDGGDGLNSKISTSLSPGSYIISVKAYNTSSTGSYRLSVNEAMMIAPPNVNSSISLGSAASGGIYQGGQIDSYSFNLRSPKTVEIRADRTDSSFDPFLELRNSSGMMIASDDDGGGGLNSKISTSLSPGSYTISVKAYNTSSTGSYRLSVNEAMIPFVGSGSGTGNFGALLIQLETSISFSAQSSGWRSRRSSWLRDVRSADGNLGRMRDLVIEFETNILSSAQNSSWLSSSRGSWVQRVRNANSIGTLATLLKECESNILFNSQSSSWQRTRNNWFAQLTALESQR